MAEERAQRDAHPVDEVLPVGRMMAFALQHVLSMYAGIIAVPLILATAIRLPQEELVYVINASFFMCGVAAGIQTLSRVDLTDNGNLVTVAVSVAFGVIPSAVPEFYDGFPQGVRIVFESGITAASVAAILLNLLFNIWGTREGRPVSTTAEATAHVTGANEVRREERRR